MSTVDWLSSLVSKSWVQPWIIVFLNIQRQAVIHIHRSFVFVNVNVFVLDSSSQPLSTDIIYSSSHTIHANLYAFFSRISKNLAEVNWDPWSELNISGFHCSNAFQRTSQQNAKPILGDTSQAIIFLLYRSIIAIRYTNPQGIFM